MANIIGQARPRIADVQCTRLQFQPGDRVLVRVYQDLSYEEYRKLRRSVEKFTGGACEVLIINANKMDIEVEHPTAINPT